MDETQEQEELEAVLKQSYKSFIKSPAGADLLEYIQSMYEAALDAAVEETDPLKSVSLLQNANGYRTIKLYIERVTSTS